MSEDKPKHKPQKKHTLSEVLKSLQDLIRTDLVTAQGALPAAGADRAQAPPPLTPTEPDSFNAALDQLDDIITHNIIEPVERAKDTPPEPLLPEETLEIEWDDTEPPAAPAKRETPELASDATPKDPFEITAAESPLDEQPQTPPQAANNVVELEIIQIETKTDDELETIDLDAPEAGANSDDNVVEFQAGDAEETEVIELAPLTDDVAPDTIELSSDAFADVAETKDARGSSSAATESDPQQELFATYIAPPAPLDHAAADAPPSRVEEPPPSAAASIAAAAAPPPAPADASDNTRDTSVDTQAEGGHDIPSLTVDFDVTLLSATLDDATAAKTSAAAGATAPPAPAPTTERVTPEPTPSKPAPPKTSENAASAPAPARSPQTPAKPAKDKPARPQNAAAAPPPPAPVQQEIPVLKEVAQINPPASVPLPNPGQARDIAIRVIAKLNIERRKAGEAPLDIKTIEKLQQYLADALNKRTLNKPK